MHRDRFRLASAHLELEEDAETLGLRHPLLLLALTRDRLPPALAALGNVLHRSLHEALPAEHRVDACLSVQLHISKLHLDHDLALALEQEVLKAAQLTLFSARVDERWLAVEFSQDDGVSDILLESLIPSPRRTESNIRSSLPHPWTAFLQTRVRRMARLPVDAVAPNLEEGMAAIRLLRLYISVCESECAVGVVFNQEQLTSLGLWMELEQRLDALGASEREMNLVGAPARLTFCRHMAGQAHLRDLTPKVKPGPKAASATTAAAEKEAASAAASLSEDVSLVPVEPGFLRVITAPIPQGCNKDESATLGRFAALRQPLPLPRMLGGDRLGQVLATLAAEFPWAMAAVQKIGSQLLARERYGSVDLAWSPLLLVGPPGCGKSRLARRLCVLLGLENMPLSLAGAHDPKLFLGTARAWSSAQPSPILQFLLQKKTARAVVVLDEVDKIARWHEGAALDAVLLSLLEPENARQWFDSFLQVPCDLSKLLFIATANQLSPLSAPLLSRFQPVLVPEPKREHFLAVAHAVLVEIAEEWGVSVAAMDPVDLNGIARNARNVRDLRSMLISALAAHVRSPRTLH